MTTIINLFNNDEHLLICARLPGCCASIWCSQANSINSKLISQGVHVTRTLGNQNIFTRLVPDAKLDKKLIWNFHNIYH